MDGVLVEPDWARWCSGAMRRALLNAWPPSRLRGIVVATLAASLCACGTGGGGGAPPRVAVLSAFPAELAAVLEHATIDDTIMVEDRVFRLGVLGGVPVVLGLTGIGLVNAAATTHAVLERFAVAGVVVSGVAGSTLQIGDVTVPEAWELKDGTTFTAHREWLDLAAEVAASGSVALERCTVVPSTHSDEPVCLAQELAIVVGGLGQSNDPFVGKAFPCQPGGGDLYGCDVAPADTATGSGADRRAMGTVAASAAAPTVNDMETAAIAREAAARGVPFIAFRAVSDGAGDPLGLPGFLFQFAAYYHLAAHNAAAATTAFLERLAR